MLEPANHNADIRSCECWCNNNICCLLYADDLVLIACNETNMQKLLNCLGNWCKKWRVKINFDKSSVIHFRSAKKRQSEYTFNIGDNKFSYVSCYKYLGLVLDEHLNYDKAIIELSASAKRALGSIISKYKTNRNMSFPHMQNYFILVFCLL